MLKLGMVSESWRSGILQKGYRSVLPGIGESGVEMIELVTGIKGGDFESDVETAKALVLLVKEFQILLEQAYRETHHTSRSMIAETRKKVMKVLAQKVAEEKGIEELDQNQFTRLINNLSQLLPGKRDPSGPEWQDFLDTLDGWQTKAEYMLLCRVKEVWGRLEG